MKDIKFIATFGDQVKTVRITQPFGAGGDYYHLFIDNYYQGKFMQRAGRWVWLGDNIDLTPDDIAILSKKIEDGFKPEAPAIGPIPGP